VSDATNAMRDLRDALHRLNSPETHDELRIQDEDGYIYDITDVQAIDGDIWIIVKSAEY
jgi:hypothetical protein